jgi:Tfp pilus assembly protein PilP
MRSWGEEASGMGAGGSVKVILTVLVVAVLALTGCQEELQSGPTTTEFDQRRSELKERLAKNEARKKLNTKPVEKVTKFASVGSGYSYSSAGKRDPFRSFIWDTPDESTEMRGPLEQFDVAQLSVLAVIWSTGNARALIQDPSGQSFIIGRGTRVGKNAGEVTKIEDNLIVVKETYEDFGGQKTTRDVEMRIRLDEGG